MQASPGPDGKMRLDPARSKVFINSLHIYVNLKGREPGGIVSPKEYEPLRNEIIRTLRDLRDPAEGEPAISFAVKKEEAGFMGMWGEGVGDIIFVYSPGHAWTGPEVLRLGERRTIFPGVGANHGPQPPWTETEISSNFATLIMAGPEVSANKIKRDTEPWIALVDLVPTICHILRLPMPQQSQGRVLQELLEGGSATKPRPPGPLMVLPKAPPRKAATKFKGDVTDEA
jgi:predicted AlkP superfamily phosphohydrolase/phosphomutase